MPDFELENEQDGIVCGVDEAGRGPWAGPVTAAAVIFNQETLTPTLAQSLNDSKKLSAKKREALIDQIKGESIWALGEASVEEIDELNILQATFLAMRRAVQGLSQKPDYALIDGNKMPPKLGVKGHPVVKGDGLSCSIAAASIIAKVTRDEQMAKLAEDFPGYGWEKNAGYGVKLHQEGLAQLGATPHHRKSFKPIKKILGIE
ncbi:ribonuclease HII, degrades RNA of DNA-RNA hybrids [Candidatus Terasakiella magnetica]|uniref:Ribonuclease HII n=1 Tax=Candidatus Terasakiella magnetica TaxID=1867952 RepID=A0A1C3RJ40_9PROT|nr:ribonuclease HII [Candidatus Terasakiella magnetica]SCA57280.1 ribonuclease HII, degrades RNA of DNA-RNA hybrids [Candidatus Terasakiella magnetica]